MRVVLLHALALSGATWSREVGWLPASTLAPNLYDYGDSISEWAAAVLDDAGGEELTLIGASVGGFCALEMARMAPRRVRTVILVGSKAGVRRDDKARDHALDVLSNRGFDEAWIEFWQPIFGPNAPPSVIDQARSIGE